MSSTIGLILAGITFLFASFITAKAIYADDKVNYKLLFSSSLVAIILQLVSVQAILFASDGLHFSFAAMCLLINVLIVSALTIRSLKFVNLMILIVTYLFSALLSFGLLLLPNDSFAFTGAAISSSAPLFVHIVLSLAAYCILIIASLYALQFRYIDAKLKAKTLSLNSHLPPLNAVEQQQFRLMTIGVSLLTLALLTGFAFLNDMWSGDHAHKTVLSLIAWVMFLILTLGHKQYGWRGTNSAIVTILASLILTLAYFGSRFVKEILLN